MSQFEQVDQTIGVAPESFEQFDWLTPYIQEISGKVVQSVTVDDFSGMGGLSSASLIRLNVIFSDESKRTYICKTIIKAGEALSTNLGLPRESFFYKLLAPALVKNGVTMPLIVYAHGDMSTGAKTIVLEDLSEGCVQSGYFFGAGSPLNWGKDLDALLITKIPVELVARDTFRRAASLHATYWQDTDLLQHKWLRGQAWRNGEFVFFFVHNIH